MTPRAPPPPCLSPLPPASPLALPCPAPASGNPDCHVILRGASSGPNYASAHVADAVAALGRAACTPRIMVDCSHGNSSKDFRKQVEVAADIAAQM